MARACRAPKAAAIIRTSAGLPGPADLARLTLGSLPSMPTIGRYQLLEKLGQGGMGVVYRAAGPLLQRIVAVKVISAPIEEDAELRERFFREARAAGQLSHKNIITIHDLGEHEGQPYLAMEYLTGQDLRGADGRPARA